MSVYELHLAHRQFDHLLEDLRVVELGMVSRA
jgi:hypothetical protein